MENTLNSNNVGFLGKRTDNIPSEPGKLLKEEDFPFNSIIQIGPERQHIRKDNSYLIVREHEELDFTNRRRAKKPALNLSRVESQYRYLFPILSKKSTYFEKDQQMEPSHEKCDSGTTHSRDPGEACKKERLTPSNSKEAPLAFNHKVQSQLKYIQKASDFLYFFYKDSMTADLDEISRRSGIQKEVLMNWIENKQEILQTLKIIKDS